MNTVNIVTEDSMKAVLNAIAEDMKTKIGNDKLNSAVDEYFKNADANSVDLQEAIVDIINNNIETIDINSVMPNLDNYITKTEANAVSERMSGLLLDEINNVKNATYTKTEVSKMINNISGGTTPVTNVLYDPSGFDEYSSIDMMHNMLIGWNLGNQFECWNKVGNQIDDINVVDRDLYYETLWGNPKVTKELINYVASVGMQAVRVPITWRDHIEPNGNAISLTWLARIKEVVDMIIESGMYCIINVHHDGSHKCKQIEFDSDYYLHSMSYFHNLWTQIGDYFKDYGYKLLFEGYNEVTNHTGNMTPNATKEGEAVKYAQDFINTVRSQGSNNAKRFLVIPNYGGVSIMSVNSFSLIKDSATDKLLLATHAYPSGSTAGDNFYWIPQKLEKNPIGIIIDEIGTMPSDKFDLAFVKDVRTQASKKQISTFWWDNGQREFNLIDRYWHVPSNAALGEYVGKDIPISTFSYDTLKSLTQMPYYAKFDLVDANHDYNKSRYMVICSQKPITDIVAVNNSRGYYGIKTDGGLYSVFVSDNARNYRVIETQLCSNTADLIIGTKHLLWGSTANSLFVESNYQIKNNPMGIQTEPEPEEPQPTEPDEPSNPEPTNPVMGSATSPYISTDKLNLNGLNKDSLDDANESIYQNRILFLKDDFEGDTLDNNLFSVSDGREPNFHISTFKPSNIAVKNSVLTLLGQKKESVDVISGKTMPYTGAQVITRLHFQNCLFEAKIRHPHEKHWCTAFWTCGYNVTGLQNWSYCGEIDVFEDVGEEKKTSFHYAGDDSTYHKHQASMKGTVLNQNVLNAFNNSGGDGQWHIHGCELMQNKVVLYFDHVPFIEYDTSSQQYYEGVNPYNYWQHFIFDSVAWNTSAADIDYKVEVDWVRAWSLVNETVLDLIPQSVRFDYLGNEGRVGTNNKIKTGTIVQLRPTYVPSTVPVSANIDTENHKTVTLSNDNFIEDGGAIKPLKMGSCDVTYIDVFGNTITNTYTSYNDSNLLPNKNVNLEDFDAATAPCIYGSPNPPAINYLNGEWTYNNKRITYGIFKAEPSTTYTITNNGNKANGVILLYEFSSDGKCLGLYGTRLSYDITSFVTKENTKYVLVEGGIAEKLVLDDYIRIKAVLIDYNLKFTKVIDISCTNVIVGDSMTIKTPTSINYTLVPSNCTDDIVFKSNNTAVATVNENGLITPISDGTAIITLTCGGIVRTIDVTVNLSQTDEPVTASYKLPSDIDTAEYANKGLLFSKRFPYHVIVHDKINNVYYAHFTNGCIAKSDYNAGKGCITLKTNTGAMDWVTMRWNTSEFPNLVDYFEHFADGRIKKTSSVPVNSGSFVYQENTEAGLKAIPTVDDIEVIYANYNIEGLYTSEFPCESVEATDMELTSPEPATLSYKTTPVFVTDELIFTSSDTSVAIIREDGIVYPQSNGTTNITVNCGSHTATCKVTVTLPEKNLTNKTVVRSNYSPNGEAFVDENIAWNRNTDTIFASFTGANTSENQSVFSVGSNATNVGSWKNCTIHTVYPYKNENGKFAFSVLMNGELRTTIPMPSDNKVKIAINKHNIYVNGTPILKNGVWRDNKTSHTTSYNDLMKLTKIAMGSTEGKNRSFANYEEISIHHNLYTATEMKQLTTV